VNQIPKILAWIGLALLIVSFLIRLPGGFQFSTRGLMEFTQTVLLVGICLGVAQLQKKS